MLLKVMRDPIAWFENCVYTKDEHDHTVRGGKRFPRFKDAPWLYYLIEKFATEKLILVPKSRQMMLSWVSCAFFLWDTQFKTNVNTFLISKKQRDANALLGRAKFIYLHQGIPTEVMNLAHTVSFNMGDLGTRSKLEFYPPKAELQDAFTPVSMIEALSQDSEAVRSNVASNVFFDEEAFLDNAEQILRAIVPAVDKYGRIAGVSSPNGKNFFCQQVFDLSEDDEAEPVIPEHAEKVSTIIVGEHRATGVHGVTRWRNPDNKYEVVRIHYTADPKKDPATPEGKDWYERVVKPLPQHAIRQEFEIDFVVKGGKRVFPHFDIHQHVGNHKAPPRCVLYPGWDFGFHRPSAVLCYDNTIMDRFEVLECFLGYEIAFRDFADTVMGFLFRAWPGRMWLHGCDPQGSWASSQGMGGEEGIENPVTYLQQRYDVDIDWDYCKPDQGQDMIRQCLMKRPGSPDDVFPFGINKTENKVIFQRLPKTKIVAGTQVLIDGMAGGCHFPLKADGSYSTGMAKNKYSHPIDALMHAFLRARRQKEYREEEQLILPKREAKRFDKFGAPANWD